MEKYIKHALSQNITIPKSLTKQETIRGVYGIFADDECLYVGKSDSIAYRMFSANGHLGASLIKGKTDKKTTRLVLNALKKGRHVEVKILEEVPIRGENMAKEMQELDSRESYYIDYYQNRGEALEQLPAGTTDKNIRHWCKVANYLKTAPV